MIKELLYATQYVLGLDKAGNDLTVFPDDVFIVSYPKSGNTWTRFLIGNLIYEGGVDFSNINEKIPDPVGLAKRYLKRLPRPRYIKSHEPYDPRFQKLILIVRDPRDVVLSEYHFDIKRRAIEEGFPIERFVDQFLEGRVNHEFGSWGANVGSWMAARKNTRDFVNGQAFLLLRYEDMMADPKGALGRVAVFLGIHSSPERIANAVERSSADRMRKMEESQSHLWSSTKDTRKDKPFVRAAKSGGWRAELPPACVAEIESAWGGLMKELNYELQTSASTEPSAIHGSLTQAT